MEGTGAPPAKIYMDNPDDLTLNMVHNKVHNISWHSPVYDRHFLTPKLTYLLIMIWDIKQKKELNYRYKVATAEKYFPWWVGVVSST